MAQPGLKARVKQQAGEPLFPCLCLGANGPWPEETLAWGRQPQWGRVLVAWPIKTILNSFPSLVSLEKERKARCLLRMAVGAPEVKFLPFLRWG